MSVGITFKNGNCIEAVEYYSNIFGIEKPKEIIRYSDFKQYRQPDDIKDRVYITSIDVYGNTIFLSDTTLDESLVHGNNVKIVIETTSDNLYRAYMNFRKDSTITYEPQNLNNKLITTLIDKYDITWQFIADITR